MKRKLDPIAVGRKRAANFEIKPHHSESDTSQSKLDSLPLDLKLEILTRLPAKSLVNFRGVSKMWSSIIRSPEFIASRQPRLVVAVSNTLVSRNKDNKLVFFSFPGDDDSSSLLANFEMAIPSMAFSHFLSDGYCTSLHGLLVVGGDAGIRICHPCTDQFLLLPSITEYVGYDPIADQYKAFSENASSGHLVLTLGEDGGWRHLEPTPITPNFHWDTGININGFVYYATYLAVSVTPFIPGIVCFDVRSEKLTYIKVPWDVRYHGFNSPFIEYKGKLAHIEKKPYGRFELFQLWVLEDIEKHEWSNTACVLPLSVWDFVEDDRIRFPGTNKAGEIIMAPTMLPTNGLPYCIFYYNVETQNIRRVRLLGIGDSQEFRRSYGFIDKGPCHVRIATQHIERITPLRTNTFQ